MTHVARAIRLAVVALLLAAAPLLLRAESPGNWYRGNLHTHSLWSDGNDFPEMIAGWYRDKGYQFLALSDHNVLSQGERWIDADDAAKRGAIGGVDRYRGKFGDDWVETRTVDGKLQVRLKPFSEFAPLFQERERFLMIPAEEITDAFESLPVHVNAINIRELIKPQGGKSVRDTMANNLRAVEDQRKRTGQAMFPHLNHPNFYYAITAEDMAAVLEERFFEVYNGHPSVGHEGDEHHAPVERLWDIANTLRIAQMEAPPLLGIATDDSHNYFGDRDASPGRGWVMVRATHLTPEKLIAALEAGDFYASSGVALEDVRFSPETGAVEIDIAAVDGEEYVTEFIGTTEGFDEHSDAVVDAEGKEMPVTRRYSTEVGRVLARATGEKPRYQLTGNELYVRAVVTSNKAPDNPAFEGQKKQAWTQPVGWRGRIKKPAATETPAAE